MELSNIEFKSVEQQGELVLFRGKAKALLTYPNDDYIDYVIDQGDSFFIKNEGTDIGFFSKSDKGTIRQFYLEPEWKYLGFPLLETIISTFEVSRILVGTNYPYFLALALRLQQNIEIFSLLFKDQVAVSVLERAGHIKLAIPTDLPAVLEFSFLTSKASEAWQTSYFSKWIARDGVYIYELDEEIQGVFEVRVEASAPGIANLGMVVSNKHRRKGLGTYLLGKAKARALELGLVPVCSCAVSNVGSLKCIEGNGFAVEHLVLLVLVGS